MNLRLGGFATTLAFGLLAFVLPLLLYCLTMPVNVVFEDDGLFLLNGVFLGVEHPPGYPVFTLVHHLFQQFPLGTAAVKGHLLSALFASGACVFVFLVVVELRVSRLVALLGALLFAATEHFWSQAIITEVYTFNCLLFFTLTLCVVRLWRDPGNRVLWTLAGAVYWDRSGQQLAPDGSGGSRFRGRTLASALHRFPWVRVWVGVAYSVCCGSLRLAVPVRNI